MRISRLWVILASMCASGSGLAQTTIQPAYKPAIPISQPEYKPAVPIAPSVPAPTPPVVSTPPVQEPVVVPPPVDAVPTPPVSPPAAVVPTPSVLPQVPVAEPQPVSPPVTNVPETKQISNAEYEQSYAKAISEPFDRAMKACIQDDAVRNFSIFLEVDEKGKTINVTIGETGPQMDCLSKKLMGLKGPPPPIAPFIVQFYMDIS